MGTGTTQLMENRLTVREAAAHAKVHEVTIRKWMANGILGYDKTKTQTVRIRPEDLRDVLSLD